VAARVAEERQQRTLGGEVGDASSPVVQREMQLQTDGCGSQACCVGVVLTERAEGGAAKVFNVLLQVTAVSTDTPCFHTVFSRHAYSSLWCQLFLS
jgi:hypothetical protein